MSKQATVHAAAPFLAGGGKMGARMRAHDWSGSPLGPPAQWTQALRTVVRLMLGASHPGAIFWGPDAACLYNDAFEQIIGPDLHPDMLGARGRDALAAVWEDIEPQIARVMCDGGVDEDDDGSAEHRRHGGAPDILSNFCFLPIDDATSHDGIGGVFVTCPGLVGGTPDQSRDARAIDTALLENVGEGIVGMGADGRILFVNPIACHLLGYDAGDLIGRDGYVCHQHHRADETPCPDDAHPIAATLRDGQRRQVSDGIFFRKDGTPFHVDYTMSPIRGGGTQDDLSYLLTFRDMTQPRGEARLHALEADALAWISSGDDLDPILSRLAARIGVLIPGMRSAIALIEDERLRTVTADELPPDFVTAIDMGPVGEGMRSCGTAAARVAQVISAGIGSDPLWAADGALARRHGLSACWSTPVVDTRGEVAAILALYSDLPRRPTDAEGAVIARAARAIRLTIDRWREAETLRRSEAHYRALFDMLPVGIWEEDWADLIPMLRDLRDAGVTDHDAFLAANPDFVERAINAVRPIRVNAASARMFGAASGEDLVARKEQITATPNARKTFCRAMTACLRGERQFGYAVSSCDLAGERLDYLLRMSVPDLDGVDTRAVLIEMDVTAQNRANERFRTVAQGTRDVIWDTDLLTQEVWASSGLFRLFGIDPNSPELSRETWSTRLHPEDRDRMLDIQSAAIANGAPGWSGEYRFRHAAGDYVIVRDQATILRDDTGRAVRMIGSMIDVTQEREIQKQLRQAQRLEAVGQLTGGVAHDFNNLLTVIIGNAEILADDLADRPEAHRLAETCLIAAERGAELTGRLLAFSRKQPLNPVDTDINRVVAGMEHLIGRTLGEAIELHIDVTEGLSLARLDPGQLEVALVNLAVNARDAMPDGGRLAFSTKNIRLTHTEARQRDVDSGPYTCVTVTDTGTGMDPSVATQAFEPFFTTKEFGKGSGLGLSLVYGFARQSGGFAEIDSRPGIGTAVTLGFPCISEQG